MAGSYNNMVTDQFGVVGVEAFDFSSLGQVFSGDMSSNPLKTVVDVHPRDEEKHNTIAPRAQDAHVEHDDYCKKIEELKQFSDRHCSELSNLFEAFKQKNFITLVHKEDDKKNKSIKADFLALLDELIKLKNQIHPEDESLLVGPSLDVFKQCVGLAKIIAECKQTCFISSETEYVNRVGKITALSNAVHAATELINKPENTIHDFSILKKCDALHKAMETMRSEIEGPAIFRVENRALCAALGAFAVVLGLGVAFALIATGVFSWLAFFAGAALVGVGMTMMSQALFADARDSSAKKIQDIQSKQAARSLTNLVDAGRVFFSPAPVSKGSVGASGRSELRPGLKVRP